MSRTSKYYKPIDDSPLVIRLKEVKTEILTAMREVIAADRTSRALSQTKSGACWTSAAKNRDHALHLLKDKLIKLGNEL